ncbi:MAG: prepilin peptidase [Parcubacteria group bacterium]|jgi:prepilin signal peptidase PulO-like enzyme (type II secretory pathway)
MIYIILFFIYGLVIGSFCNVVICRLRTGEGLVVQKSHCPQCKKNIAWKDNIPVLSYILLRGKCRACQKKISMQYPLVEFATGAIFGAVGAFFVHGSIDHLLVAVLYAFVFAHLVVIFVYDWKYMEIPMNVMWMAIALLIVANMTRDLHIDAFWTDVWSSVSFTHGMSAVVAFCFFFGLSYISDETWMGYGDAFIAIAIGLLLGPIGTFIALLVAFCVGAIYGIGLMVIKKRSLKTEVPFGPFLIFGLGAAFVVQNVYPHMISLFL